jgi:hypothetical protein
MFATLTGIDGGGVGGGVIGTLEPDKNYRHATIGGKQRKTV